MGEAVTVTADQISSAVRPLGVAAGDLLLVHSSLSSFGRVQGGADAVVGALLGAISPGGTLFVPTFTYGRLPFDPATTPSLAGAITEAVRRRPDAVRSGHSTHSLAGVGPDARAMLEGHERTTPFGPGSPVWRLWERDAWVLLIGVDHRASSMIHVAEELSELPYLNRTRVVMVLRGSACVEETVRRPGHSGGFNKVDAALRAAGEIRESRVGGAPLRLMRAGAVVRVAREILRQDVAGLLCGDAGCERCAEARAIIAAVSGR